MTYCKYTINGMILKGPVEQYEGTACSTVPGYYRQNLMAGIWTAD